MSPSQLLLVHRKRLRISSSVVGCLIAVIALASFAPFLRWTNDALPQNSACLEKEMQGEDRETEQLPLCLADQLSLFDLLDDARSEFVVLWDIKVSRLREFYSHPLRGPPTGS